MYVGSDVRSLTLQLEKVVSWGGNPSCINIVRAPKTPQGLASTNLLVDQERACPSSLPAGCIILAVQMNVFFIADCFMGEVDKSISESHRYVS